MKRLALAAVAVTLAAWLAPSANAKGASQATITGPGIAGPIVPEGEGSDNGGSLMQLAEASGFFPSVYATTPNPMPRARPTQHLGPRYTIAYVMPGPNSEVSTLHQDLYPYATPSAVTYMKPGQRFFGTERTVGGWYVAASDLRGDLVSIVLPATPPIGGGSGFPWTVAGVLVAAAVAALGACVLALRRRPGPRQPRTTPA